MLSLPQILSQINYSMNESLDFLRVHSLVHKLFAPEFNVEDRINFAQMALQIMDLAQALHPLYPKILAFLQENEALTNDILMQYGPQWAAAIKDRQIAAQLEEKLENYCGTETDKLSGLRPKFRQLYVTGESSGLFLHINRLAASEMFRLHCNDHEQVIHNRYFEFLFYHVAAIVYGELWFQKYCVLEEELRVDKLAAETRNWRALEKKAWMYYNNVHFLVSALTYKREDVVEAFQAEYRYFYLIRWLCAFARFKDNNFVDFMSDYKALKDHIDCVSELHLSQELAIMYEIASLATKPFCELVADECEVTMELQSGSSDIEVGMFSVISKLAVADFAGAKRDMSLDLTSLLDANMGYIFPKKLAGSFWRYLTVVVDLKVFLLIMSCALVISRDKLLDKLGYKDASSEQRIDVTATMVLVSGALGLGQSNVTYDQSTKMFTRRPVTDLQKRLVLQEEIEHMDHSIEAEAVAQLIKSRLIQNV